ncbi:hypothetical protein QYM36_013436 [Artemia franciscana]|uniref:Transcription factor TFIIIC triple barrel domain-containing protein n=1 Tax=Artemia franciscana TaxID=6661 RepID=A0AA88HIC0_ARTSF|nr:hypothetical protein QYM36_013436 [Artemia franciscana]
MDIKNEGICPSQSDEYEYEEELVILKLTDTVKEAVLDSEDIQINMVGFETGKPLLQVGSRIHECELQGVVGTSMIFIEKEKQGDVDIVVEKALPNTLEFQCCVQKEMAVKRMFVRKKACEE